MTTMMIARPNYAPAVFLPVSLIGSQFMAPYTFDIMIDTNSTGNLVITDINHRILLKVKPCNTTFHRQRVLLDVNDTPIAILRKKIMTEHNPWNVFRGDSKAKSDMIFCTKTPHMVQFKTSLHVFLAKKTSKKDVCDFKIKGSWSKKNCTNYTGDSAIAQMHTTHSSENVKFVKDKFMVTIYPNVDYAFVIAVIAIVDALKNADPEDESPGEVTGAVAEVAGAIVPW